MARENLKKWAEQLRNDTIDEQPRDYQWDGKGYEYDGDTRDGLPGWRSWEACECEKCGRVLVLEPGNGNDSHANLDDCQGDDDSEPTACDGNIPAAEGPMMSYWYPCPISNPVEAARKIAGLPVCVVEVDGARGLALTGGGMDLSWEICEAYTRLGYLPPIHYAGRLPRMADRYDEGKRRVIAAARRAAEIRVMWAQRAVEDVGEVEAWFKARERKRASKK